ncbi:hypothetical protein HPB52_021152 [Rhipicephalus sanguineus]|uniref:Uncharacterized protein n=1 Tax=Rhipicephalus sanguineus TaxID=34632 RepID=A0A9D4PCL7_RHISA|nr:hypothetical protein HPB52_021152 [Rhipicephalus sanguineus]
MTISRFHVLPPHGVEDPPGGLDARTLPTGRQLLRKPAEDIFNQAGDRDVNGATQSHSGTAISSRSINESESKLRFTNVKVSDSNHNPKSVLKRDDIGTIGSLTDRLETNNAELDKLNEIIDEHITDKEFAAEFEAVMRYQDAARGTIGEFKQDRHYCDLASHRLNISSATYATMMTNIMLRALPTDVVVEYHRDQASETPGSSRDIREEDD